VRILFWGTPDFALPALRALTGEGHDVVGVVTQPDRPAGRGRALRISPVKQAAQDDEIPVLQPEKARGPDFLEAIKSLTPDLSVVVGYGQILRPDVLAAAPLGSINVHASLLPELRGAAPVNWAIIRGYTETGVSIMRMAERMDAGPILLQINEPIAADERASDLWTRLSEIGAAALVEALALLEAGMQVEREQDETRATYAPRIEKQDARIDWSKNAVDVDRLIRGLDEMPGAWSQLGEHPIKIFRPLIEDAQGKKVAPGTVLQAEARDAARGVLVACGLGSIWVREVTPPGKRRMTAAEWVRGRGVVAGDCFV
jgi:methionyl-tRNA formyltransferase